jgi:hypothetical protein
VAVTSASRPAVDPKPLAVRAQDLPHSFKREGGQYVTLALYARGHKVSLAVARRSGFVTGYLTAYDEGPGGTAVFSVVSVFETAPQASVLVEQERQNCAPGAVLSQVNIGVEADFCKFTATAIPSYTITWQRGKIAGLVLIFGRKAKAAEALALARRQDGRTAAAAAAATGGTTTVPRTKAKPGVYTA